MGGKRKTVLVLAGLLASGVALGTGCERAQAEARPQDLPQQPRDEDTLEEPGTGGTDTTRDEDRRDEPGTGGAGGTGEDTVRDEDEGVLQPGVRDEGLDHDEGQADEDTVYQGTRQQPPED